MAGIWENLGSILNDVGGAYQNYYNNLALVNAAQARAEAAKVGVVTAQQAQTQVSSLETYMPYIFGAGALMLLTVVISSSRR